MNGSFQDQYDRTRYVCCNHISWSIQPVSLKELFSGLLIY